MNCKKCEVDMYWLYYGEFPFREPKQTDYVICPKCEEIYRQVIHTKVEWIPIIVSELDPKGEEVK